MKHFHTCMKIQNIIAKSTNVFSAIFDNERLNVLWIIEKIEKR